MSTRRWFLLGVVTLALAACDPAGGTSSTTVPRAASTIEPASTVTASIPTTSTTPSTTADPTTTTTIVDEDLVPPLAIYLAAIDRGLTGTRYEGDVYLDPELFVSTGRLFCSLLDAGVSPSEVLASYYTALEEESSDVGDDDLLLGGVVLGASVRVICPEHADLVMDGGAGGP